MKQYFIQNGLSISIGRTSKGQLSLSISSDYSRSQRKSTLWVDSKRFGQDVEDLWKSIKTKKLLSVVSFFDEIDYYDNLVDVYETPVARIERGLKKIRMGEHEHGCIPKDWSINMDFSFADTTTNTPILEVVKATLGSYFTPLEKEFIKGLKPVLQKKQNHFDCQTEF